MSKHMTEDEGMKDVECSIEGCGVPARFVINHPDGTQTYRCQDHIGQVSQKLPRVELSQYVAGEQSNGGEEA